MKLAPFIDHTILKPDCVASDIRSLCSEAIEYQFAAVCIPPYYVQDAYQLLKDHPVKVATVAGFPLGYSTTFAKVEEIKRAIDDGADEVDVVINIAAVKNGNWNYVENDIASMTTAAHIKGKQIKIILETGMLTEEEIVRLCGICAGIGPEFVKTSTGFNGPGASLAAVRLMRDHLTGTPIRIKASGGIRSAEEAKAMIEAGAQRIGTSSGIRIVTEL
jgi:deoxyribose-phosphate aldolase